MRIFLKATGSLCPAKPKCPDSKDRPGEPFRSSDSSFWTNRRPKSFRRWKNGYPTTTDNHLLLIPFAGLPKKASLRWSQSVGGTMVLTRIKFGIFGVAVQYLQFAHSIISRVAFAG